MIYFLGDLCEYTSPNPILADGNSFPNFFDSLDRTTLCPSSAAGYTFNWTGKIVFNILSEQNITTHCSVAADTPDISLLRNFVWYFQYNLRILVYYNCYTHTNLGWKIRVFDQGLFV